MKPTYEELEAACAAVREALEHQTGEECEGTFCCELGIAKLTHALSSTAGADLLARMKRMEEALNEAADVIDEIADEELSSRGYEARGLRSLSKKIDAALSDSKPGGGT